MGSFATPAVLVIGVGANRLYTRSTGNHDDRWIFTEEETADLGGALGRIVARRIPEELVEGENGDYMVIVGTLAGYLFRNLLGLSAEEMARAQEEGVDYIEGRVVDEERNEAAPRPDQATPPAGPGPVLDATAVGAV